MSVQELAPPRPRPSVHHLLGATAPPASRAWGAILTFVLMVLLPFAAANVYLWAYAAERYASRTAFSIRSNDTTAPLEIFGAITQLGTSSAVMDGEILYDFIQSQAMLDAAEQTLDLAAIYNRAPEDPLFALGEDQPVEELLDHWLWMTDVAIDPGTGILTVEARAFAPEDARAIAGAILEASAALVNTLSDAAREDAVRHAAGELEGAEARLRAIRSDLRAFRDLEQEVDPTQNAQAALGLVATLEEDRARTQVQLDQLAGVLNNQAPRVQGLRRRLATLDARIAEERTRLGSGSTTEDGRQLADVVGDYEELVVDREFAEQAYTLALATFEQAQAEARRQSRYLAVHIEPTLSEEAEYPDQPIWLGASLAALLAAWAIAMLVVANIRERG
ncbi:MAG: capsule biosynthesis protein [Pseudomonadota bacterium]